MSELRQVKTQFQVIATPDNPFMFRNGESLDHVTIAYETYGTLNEEKSNAILLFHAFSGSQHAAGYNPAVEGNDLWTQECNDGWWELFIGPGKALDTDKYFIICANYIGGCYGSTGPSTINPETGKPHGSAFPHVTVNDIVRSLSLIHI